MDNTCHNLLIMSFDGILDGQSMAPIHPTDNVETRMNTSSLSSYQMDNVETKLRTISSFLRTRMSTSSQERQFQLAIAIECRNFFRGLTVVTEQPIQTIYVDSRNTRHSLGTGRIDIYMPELGLLIELKKQRPQPSHELQLRGYMENAAINGLCCKLGVLICFFVDKGTLQYSFKTIPT